MCVCIQVETRTDRDFAGGLLPTQNLLQVDLVARMHWRLPLQKREHSQIQEQLIYSVTISSHSDTWMGEVCSNLCSNFCQLSPQEMKQCLYHLVRSLTFSCLSVCIKSCCFCIKFGAAFSNHVEKCSVFCSVLFFFHHKNTALDLNICTEVMWAIYWVNDC